MAITPISGNVGITASAATTAAGARTQSITIPTGARFALISFGGARDGGNASFTSISLDGNAATLIGNSNTVTSFGYDVALAWVALTSGNEGSSKTLAWTNSHDLYEGGNVLVRFYSGVDTSDPVRSSGVNAADGDATINPGSLTAQSGDLAVAVANTYQPYRAIAWTNATEVFDVVGGGDVEHSWAEASPSASITISAFGSYPGLVVAIIKPSGDAAATALPRRALDGPFYGALRGSVR
jgi:hypothetical protein